jgi:hypothetical protein
MTEMPRVMAMGTRMSLMDVEHRQVCARTDATDEEIQAACPGFSTVRRDVGNELSPAVCDDDAERLHFVVTR